jgi:hypothetical protein
MVNATLNCLIITAVRFSNSCVDFAYCESSPVDPLILYSQYQVTLVRIHFELNCQIIQLYELF